MTVTTRLPLKVRMPLRDDTEQEIIARLIEATGEASGAGKEKQRDRDEPDREALRKSLREIYGLQPL